MNLSVLFTLFHLSPGKLFKMSKVQMLRALVNQRLTAAAEEIFVLFERTIAEYEEELSRSKEENQRQQKLLDAVFNPQLQLHRADVQQLVESKEEFPPEQQERSSSLDQEDPEPPHIKEEQEELWTGQEGEQLQGLEEADITKFTFTPVPVKTEDDEEKPQSSQLHPTRTEENKDLVGGEEARNSEPETHLHPDTDDKMTDCSEAVKQDGWTETQSSLNSVNHNLRCNTGKKQYNCSECGKIFHNKKCLNRHMRIHAGEKSFKCPFCGKAFVRKEGLTQHVRLHTGEKPFSCRVCDKRFTWPAQVRKHHCVGESSQTEHMETEADGGSEPDRNSHPDRLLHPDTDAETSDSYETDVSDDDWTETRKPQSRLNTLKNKKDPLSDVSCNAVKRSFSCSECGQRFGRKPHLNAHMRIHTGEKTFRSNVSNTVDTNINTESEPASIMDPDSHLKPVTYDQLLEIETDNSDDWKEISEPQAAVNSLENDDESEMQCNTDKESFSCSECGRTFCRRDHLMSHMRTHTGEELLNCNVAPRRKFDVKFKERVLQYAEENSGEKTARHFGIDPKRIRYWKKQKSELLLADKRRARLSGGGRKKVSLELERRLSEWIYSMQDKHKRVSRKMIKNKALEIYPSVSDGGKMFVASRGWLQKFLQRNDFSLQHRTTSLPRPTTADSSLI